MTSLEATTQKRAIPGVHFEVVGITDKNRFQIMERAEPFHEQLKLAKGRNFREIYTNLEVGGEAVFAVLDGARPMDIAIVEGRLKTVVLGAGREYKIYMRFLRAVASGFQQQSIGTLLTDEIVERLEPDGFSGRTPNPFVFRADEQSRHIEIIFPINKLFTTRTAMMLLGTLDEEQRREVNPRTGRCAGVYPPGAFRLFCLENASQRSGEIYERMTGPEIKANLEAGDGIRYLELVRKGHRGLSLRAA